MKTYQIAACAYFGLLMSFGCAKKEEQKEEGILEGLPVSQGIARGRACFVKDPSDFGKVKSGDILVARTTNPVWTQLFGTVAAVVVENGSMLSHAAIVAREFSIPAVVWISDLMKVIKHGEMLEVNGTTGKVGRLDYQ